MPGGDGGVVSGRLLCGRCRRFSEHPVRVSDLASGAGSPPVEDDSVIAQLGQFDCLENNGVVEASSVRSPMKLWSTLRMSRKALEVASDQYPVPKSSRATYAKLLELYQHRQSAFGICTNALPVISTHRCWGMVSVLVTTSVHIAS